MSALCHRESASLWEKHGLQRYRCVNCRRTFNPLTGTPLSRLRKKGKWPGYLESMEDTISLRKAASSNGIHVKTAFLWRHRFLSALSKANPLLSGIVEADETYVRQSSKGDRKLARPARRRGGKWQQVSVHVGRDRNQNTADAVLDLGGMKSKHLRAHFQPVLSAAALQVSDFHVSYDWFAKEIGQPHERINMSLGKRVRGAYHIQNVNAYHSRLKQWLRGFKGVSTNHLLSYLGWCRFLDKNGSPELKDWLLPSIKSQFNTLRRIELFNVQRYALESERTYLQDRM